MARKLIIDADPGIGDALAIALAVLDPHLDLLAITATSGCVSGPVATRNIMAVLESIDPDKWPRTGASAVPRPVLSRSMERTLVCDPAVLNGNYGLGTAELPFAELHHPRESPRMLVELVRQFPHEVTLLTLGPLTNVAVACEMAPDLLDQLQGLVILGGTLHGHGDVTPATEFNIHAAPEAARSVLLAPGSKTLVPLETSTQATLTFDCFDRLKQSRPLCMRWFFDDLLPFALRAHHEHLGRESMALPEVTALAAITSPRHFRSRPLTVDIELSGTLTRGATVFDHRRGSWHGGVNVVDSVEPQGVLDYMSGVLRGR